MKLGIHYYVTGYTIDPVTIARAVEDAGFESFWVPEHAVLATHTATPFPMTGGEIPPLYGHMADPFVLLSFIGAATTRLKLGTGVCIVPERQPLVLAKTVSTLDNFSNGRVLFGMGVGWAREEIELFGVNFDTRWSYTREAVEAMKALWATGTASYAGKYVNFPELVCDPLPAQPGGPPIIFGALPSEVNFRRIAKWGDGWITFGPGPEEVRQARKGITAECEKIGRDPSEIEISVGVWEIDPATRDAFEEAGADRLIAVLYNHPGTPVSHDDFLQVAIDACHNPPPTPTETLAVLDGIVERAKL
jgi:probable F420-dependent oxidoreductase